MHQLEEIMRLTRQNYDKNVKLDGKTMAWKKELLCSDGITYEFAAAKFGSP